MIHDPDHRSPAKSHARLVCERARLQLDGFGQMMAKSLRGGVVVPAIPTNPACLPRCLLATVAHSSNPSPPSGCACGPLLEFLQTSFASDARLLKSWEGAEV
jgi:hypothetical protein